jgi:hypothetical protein
MSFPFDYTEGKKKNGDPSCLGEKGVIIQDYTTPFGHTLKAGREIYKSTTSGVERLILPGQIAVVPAGETNFIGVPPHVVEFRNIRH